MAVSLTVEEVSLPVDVGGVAKYRVTWTVLSNTDIPAEIFVVKTHDLSFARVAHVGSFVYPTTPSPATSKFHRVATVSVDYNTIAEANKQKIAVAADLATLQVEYQAALDDFTGTVNIDVP